MEAVEKEPGREAGQDIKGAVGEVGNPADSVGQGEAKCSQGQSDAIDKAINEKRWQHPSLHFALRWSYAGRNPDLAHRDGARPDDDPLPLLPLEPGADGSFFCIV